MLAGMAQKKSPKVELQGRTVHLSCGAKLRGDVDWAKLGILDVTLSGEGAVVRFRSPAAAQAAVRAAYESSADSRSGEIFENVAFAEWHCDAHVLHGEAAAE